MASIQKRGTKWIAEIRTKGKYASRSFESKGLAKAWADEEERLLGRIEGIVEGKTLAQAFQRYSKEVAAFKKGRKWECNKLAALQEDDIADIPLPLLKLAHFEGWRDTRLKSGVKSSTVNRELNLISAVLTQAVKWKWVQDNPMSGIERPKNPRHRDKCISDSEILRILDALGYVEGEAGTLRQKIAVAFLLAIETAMRQGEIWSLTWENIHFQQKTAYLPDTKNGDPRSVPLSKKAIALLESMPRAGNRVFNTPQFSAGAVFSRTLTLAGLKGIHFHDTRHTALTRMAKKLSMLELARVAGHRDPRNLMIYFNPTTQDLAERLD